MTGYQDPADVKALLKGAKPVRTLSDVNNHPYGAAVFSMPQQEVKTLFSGPSGNFIVHCAFWVNGAPPEARVLSLPADLDPDSFRVYESEHQKDYSPWYKMDEAGGTRPRGDQ